MKDGQYAWFYISALIIVLFAAAVGGLEWFGAMLLAGVIAYVMYSFGANA